MIGALGFVFPWALLGLAALPALWWLLRVTPPPPRRAVFPALALLQGLPERDRAAARTPWPLLLLRCLIAACVILAFAQPLWRPAAPPPGVGPLIIAIEDGWAAGQGWALRQAAALAATTQAEREGRLVGVLSFAPQPGGEAPRLIGPGDPREARAALEALTPKPWPSDRAAALALLRQAEQAGRAGALLLIDDGLAERPDGRDPALTAMLEIGQRLGGAKRITPTPADAALLLPPPRLSPGRALAQPRRAETSAPGLIAVRAVAADGRVLAREVARFPAGAATAEVTLALPSELAEQLQRFELEGVSQAGAVALVDGSARRRAVGLATAEGEASLLRDDYYLTRALAPFAELRRGTIAALVAQPPSLLLISDELRLSPAERGLLRGYMAGGGVVGRFAGPNLAEQPDEDLVPTRLRPGGRALDGALQWGEAARLAPFDASSPFTGLAIPPDLTVSRMVLAAPSAELSERSWARLTDGTPLVTADRRGEGWLVLFHVPATPEWSSLPMSGLFVDMLRRLTQLGRGDAAAAAAPALPALLSLDGQGRLGPAPGWAAPAGPGATVGPAQPPGFYGDDSQRRALNLAGATTPVLTRYGATPAGTEITSLAPSEEQDLKGGFLLLAGLLWLVDLLASLWLRGLWRPPGGPGSPQNLISKRGSKGLPALGPGVLRTRRVLRFVSGANKSILLFALIARTRGLLAPLSIPQPGRNALDPSSKALWRAVVFTWALAFCGAAQAQTPADAAALKFAQTATEGFRLAHILTGDAVVDDTAKAGLHGLGRALYRRTAVEPEPPLGVDLERDALLFFPLLYWPITETQPAPSPAAAAKISAYLATGGVILFDLRDGDDALSAAAGSPQRRALRRLLAGIDLPPLAPTPPDHALTRSFYLLQSFPGRRSAGTLWIQLGDPAREEMSGVMIGASDYAAAWATDESGRPLYAVSPGGDRQREMALRFGVNLAMYVLTGNYKIDQVHAPAIMERLGR